jgi:microcystin-dependent protein
LANISVANSTYTVGGLDTRFTLDGTSEATFQQMNGAASGVIAIETVLGDGSTLKGSMADLVARLAVSMSAAGKIGINTNGVFAGLTDLYGLIADSTNSKLVPKNIAPAGMVVAWTTASAPTHWLLCDGSEVSRTTYATLFAAIGITYGAGNGTTTFTLPDLRGRVIIMVDGAANRITAASTGGNNADSLAGQGGTETHTLVTGEIPAHAHAETYSDGLGTAPDTILPQSTNATGGGGDTETSLSSDNQGGGGAHSNTQPWLALNYIIYAGA